MFLSNLRVLRRRWYATLAGVLLTVGLAAAAMSLVPVRYLAETELLLLPPRSPGIDGTNSNPYMALGGLDGMADVIARAMMDEVTATAMVTAGVASRYQVIFDRSAAGPILVASVEEDTPARAEAALATLTAQVPKTAAKIQADSSVSEGVQITIAVIGRKAAPTPVTKPQLRAVLVAVVAGLGATVLGTSLLDSSLARRAGSGPRPARRAAAAGPPPPGGGQARPPGGRRADPGASTTSFQLPVDGAPLERPRPRP